MSSNNAAGGSEATVPHKPSKLLADARQLWDDHVRKGETPLICSSEGFYQHTGECANDSMQMVLCFCDHFKERVQEILLTQNLEVGEKYNNYVRALQRRFVRHYLNEHNRDPSLPGRFRAAGMNALKGAIAAKYGPNSHISTCEYVEKKLAGMTANDIIRWFGELLNMFGLKSVIELAPPVVLNGSTSRLFHIVTPNTVGFLITAGKRGASMESHAMAYYKCGDVEYFYDDNSGPIPFAWSAFFDEIRKADAEIPEPVRIHIYHVLLRFEDNSDGVAKRDTLMFYPVFDIEYGAAADIRKNVFYTFFPYTSDLMEMRYTTQEKDTFETAPGARSMWFSRHYDNGNKFGIFKEDILMPLRYRESVSAPFETAATVVTQKPVPFGRMGKVFHYPGSSSNQGSSDDDDGLGTKKQPVPTLAGRRRQRNTNTNLTQGDEKVQKTTGPNFQRGGRRLAAKTRKRRACHRAHRRRQTQRRR